MMPVEGQQAWAGRLERLGLAVRRRLGAGEASSGSWAEVVGREGGDTIFAVDRQVEPALEEELAGWPAECLPLLLIAEGLPGGLRRLGPPDRPLRYRLLVDPIDGTRGLMYDKRSAWFLAAVAEDRGEGTSLADTFAAALVELPVRKQGWADAFWAVAGRPARGRRVRLDGGECHDLAVRPSRARGLRQGFGHVVSFFPGTKVLAAELMERVAEAAAGPRRPGDATAFDDQYISTGGQLVELMVGHDRFCADLRPLLARIQARRTGAGAPPRGLECHPYDLAGALVARQGGVILTDGFGRPLRPPLDVHTGVHWCGYANADLQRRIEPVIQAWLAEHDLYPDEP